jgi:hypothetical protein
MIAVLVVGGQSLGWVGAPSAAAYPLFCANHAEYRNPLMPLAAKGDIYKSACAIPLRLCLPALVQAARPRPVLLVPRTVHSTAWMTPCDFEQGRGSSDVAAGHHRGD